MLDDTEQYEQLAQAKAHAEGSTFERLPGDRRLLTALVYGEWNEEEFLVVPLSHMIKQSGNDSIIKATPVA